MITIRDALAAMKKDGLLKIKKDYFEDQLENRYTDKENVEELALINVLDPKYIKGGCAAGQCAYNLDLIAITDTVERELNKALHLLTSPIDGIHTSTSALNDNTDLSVPEIAGILYKRAEELNVLDQEMFV
jgi:hypothetical protein